MNMRPHPDVETIDAFAEDLLDGARRAELEEHLRGCERCRDEVERQRALLAALRAMPPRIGPGVDLRPAIRRAVGTRAAAHTRARVLRSLRVPLATAALLLIAVTATVTTLLLDEPAQQGSRVAFERDGDAAATPARFDATRAEYVRTADELAALLELHRDELEPETVALIERNLQTIDQALREADAALRADSASPVIREMILANHAKRVEVLRWANSLIRG